RPFERSYDEIGVPAGPFAGGIGVVDWKGLDQPETDAVLGIASIGAVAADIAGGIDAIGERLSRGRSRRRCTARDRGQTQASEGEGAGEPNDGPARQRESIGHLGVSVLRSCCPSEVNVAKDNAVG